MVSKGLVINYGEGGYKTGGGGGTSEVLTIQKGGGGGLSHAEGVVGMKGFEVIFTQ